RISLVMRIVVWSWSSHLRTAACVSCCDGRWSHACCNLQRKCRSKCLPRRSAKREGGSKVNSRKSGDTRPMRLAIVWVFALTAWPGIALAQQAIVLDRYMSPAAGTGDLLTIQRGLATVEDRVLPLKLGDERGRLSLLAGIFYRTGKFVGLDVPQDHMLLVVGHEVFGHGARLRELGVGRIAYSFDGPLPYG